MRLVGAMHSPVRRYCLGPALRGAVLAEEILQFEHVRESVPVQVCLSGYVVGATPVAMSERPDSIAQL